ncbi:MAG: NTP transferase domain-containing protein [Pseudanabaenaceae cyanobacterium]
MSHSLSHSLQTTLLTITPIIMAGGDSRRMGKDKGSLIWRGMPLICHMIDVAASFSNMVYIVTDKSILYQELFARFKYDFNCDLTNHRSSDQKTCLAANNSIESIKSIKGSTVSLYWINDVQKQGPLVGFYTGLIAIETAQNYPKSPQVAEGTFFTSNVANYCESILTAPQKQSTYQVPNQMSMMQIGSELKTDHWLLLLSCDLPLLEATALLQWSHGLSQLSTDTIAYLPSYIGTEALPQPTKDKNNGKFWHSLCGFYRPQCLTSLGAAVNQGERSFQRWLAGEVVAEIPDVPPMILTNCNNPEQWQQVLRLETS